MYQKSKDKGVVMAAKGLQSLYREVYPELLQKKQRGKTATMGLRSGEVKQRKFGEQEQGGIEGIELLEQYKEEQRKRKLEEAAENGETKKDDDEDDDGFNSDEWEVASTDSDTSGEWINVSDDEDDEPAKKRLKADTGDAPDLVDTSKDDEAEINRISTLATTSILTPADLAKLEELLREAKIDKALGRTSKRKKELIDKHIEDGITAEDIEMPALLGKKLTKEERVALAREGKPGRDEHKSTQAIRKSKKEAEGKSTTNKEKARKKNFLMTIGKARAKNKRSLVETSKSMKNHIARAKSGGRRKNGVSR
jgi:protein SDA1